MTLTITEKDIYRLRLRPAASAESSEKPLTSYDFDDPSNRRRMSLTDYWTDITTSEIKSDISFFLNGAKGSGKSYLNLTLGYCCALHYVEKLGGHWTDWYNIDLTAIIDPVEQLDLLKLEAKYVVKNFDDRSIGYDSHNWQSEENASQNNMNIVNRTENNIQLTSSPDQGYVDKRGRELCNFYGEAERIVPALKMGMNVARIFRVEKNTRSGKRYYPNLWHDDCKLVKACIGKSDAALKHLREEYDEKRAKNSKKLQRGEFDEVLGKNKKIKGKDGKTINARTHTAMQNALELGMRYYRLIDEGMTQEEALLDIMVQKGTFKKWEKAGWVSREKCFGTM